MNIKEYKDADEFGTLQDAVDYYHSKGIGLSDVEIYVDHVDGAWLSYYREPTESELMRQKGEDQKRKVRQAKLDRDTYNRLKKQFEPQESTDG